MLPGNTYVVQITITGGNPVVTLYSGDGTDFSNQTMPVDAGDRVAWFLQLVLPKGRVTPPYTVSFGNASFFGVPSLHVPNGGTSEFLQVRALRAKTKYSVDVSGLGLVLDPVMQSGTDGGGSISATGRGAPVYYEVQWDVAAGTMEYYDVTNGGPGHNLPLPVAYDKNQPVFVTFTAVTNGKGQNFSVTFSYNGASWASPFDIDAATFNASADAPLSIGPLLVGDNVDHNVLFPFTASIDGTPSNIPASQIKLA